MNYLQNIDLLPFLKKTFLHYHVKRRTIAVRILDDHSKLLS